MSIDHVNELEDFCNWLDRHNHQALRVMVADAFWKGQLKGTDIEAKYIAHGQAIAAAAAEREHEQPEESTF